MPATAAPEAEATTTEVEADAGDEIVVFEHWSDEFRLTPAVRASLVRLRDQICDQIAKPS